MIHQYLPSFNLRPALAYLYSSVVHTIGFDVHCCGTFKEALLWNNHFYDLYDSCMFSINNKSAAGNAIRGTVALSFRGRARSSLISASTSNMFITFSFSEIWDRLSSKCDTAKREMKQQIPIINNSCQSTEYPGQNLAS